MLAAFAAALFAGTGVASADVGPAYQLTAGGGTLQAAPVVGGSTLAVQVTKTASGLEFTPAAASPGTCTNSLGKTTCPASFASTKLILQGSVLAVGVHAISTGTLQLTGGSGADTVVVDGTVSPDVIGTVSLNLGDGNDSVTLGGAINAIAQSPTPDPSGDDRYVITSTSPGIVGTLALGDGNDFASSQAPNLTLDGGAGNDTLIGAGPMIGGTGSDVLEPTALGKVIAGGDGAGDVDLLSYQLMTTPLSLTKTSATDVNAGDGAAKTGIEVLEGGQGNDTLTGTGGPDVLYGGDGDDVIDGRGGGDTLDGGPGQNTVTYALGPSPVTVDLGAGTGGALPLDTLRHFTTVITGPGNDTVTGTSADEHFILGAGDDTVDAGAGNDTIDGGPGNDLLRGGEGSDIINGGDGTDTATYDERGPSEPVNVTLATPGGDGAAGENDTLTQIENVTGGASSDTLIGDDGPNVLVGGPGLNTLSGLGGDDVIFGGDDRDIITGGPGSDKLYGGGDDDSIDAFADPKPDTDIVDCGPSLDDDAQVDPTDQVTGCEYARRGDVPVPVDNDHDGFVAGFDCNDSDPAIHPGAVDIPADGIDQDCDGFDATVPYVDFGLTAKQLNAKAGQLGSGFSTFHVTRLTATTSVQATCKAPKKAKVKCPFKSVTLRPKKGSTQVSLTARLKSRRLSPGTTLELRVTAPGFNGRLRRFTITAASFKSDQFCITAPKKTPQKCPSGDEL